MFDETHPEFKGFNAFYERELLPALQGKELDRKQAFKKLNRIAPLLVIGILIGGGLIFAKTRHPFILAVTGMMAAGGYAGLRSHYLKDVKNRTKNHLVSGICKFIGWEFVEEISDPPDLGRLIDNGMLPKGYDRVNFEDKMRGKAHKADFEALECHMERQDRDSDGKTRWVTVFRGSLMALDFHQARQRLFQSQEKGRDETGRAR